MEAFPGLHQPQGKGLNTSRSRSALRSADVIDPFNPFLNRDPCLDFSGTHAIEACPFIHVLVAMMTTGQEAVSRLDL